MNEIKDEILTVDGFKDVCRVCLQLEGDMIDIFTVGIHTQIMEVINLKVEANDQLPNTICLKCKLQMENIIEFIEQAKSSDTYLRSLLVTKELEEDSMNPSTEEEKDQRKKSPRKRLKKWGRKTKNKKSRGDSDDDKMYLIYVPKTDDSTADSEIFIKDLNSDDDNSELSHYCRSLVNNHVSDHTYPKESATYSVNLDIYECGACRATFEEMDDLSSHVSTHDPQPVIDADFCFTCPVCCFTEKDKIVFLTHLQNHSEEGFSFVKANSVLVKAENRIFLLNLSNTICSVCCKNIEKDDITKHLETHTGDVKFNIKYTCPVCCVVFIAEQNFIQHLSNHQKEFYFIKVGQDGEPIKLESSDSIYVPFSDAKNFYHSLGKIFKIICKNSCDKCDYTAESFSQLSQHYRSSHSEELSEVEVGCPVCLEIFNLDESQVKLFEHLRVHKEEGVVFILVKRDNSIARVKEEYLDVFTQSAVLLSLADLSSYEMYSPELVVSGTKSAKYTCDLCRKDFSKKKDVIAHLKSHQVEGSQESLNYICEKCGKKCSGKGNYRRHFLQHTKGLGVGRRPTCTICNKTFANRVSLNGHMRHHLGEGEEFQASLGIICEKCGKGFSNNASLTKHKKLHLGDKENAILKCEICDRDFFRQSSFDRHKSAHLNPKYFECDICKLPLSSVSSLQKHLDTHRNGSNTFDCKACKLSFLTKDSLTAHQTHTGHYIDRKPLECNVCHEKFFIGRKFTEHIKTHPKYKMGECTLCGKRLSTIQSLMLHMGRHFETNSILCPHCGKQFFEERNYHRHLLTHEGIKPFPCDVEDCKKSFYTLFELNRHKKYHNNTRDFRCPYCSKSFHEANHLTVHVRTHTGERPYTCPHCSKGFVTRTRCKHHIKLVHQGIGYDLIQSSISKKVTVFEAVETIV